MGTPGERAADADPRRSEDRNAKPSATFPSGSFARGYAADLLDETRAELNVTMSRDVGLDPRAFAFDPMNPSAAAKPPPAPDETAAGYSREISGDGQQSSYVSTGQAGGDDGRVGGRATGAIDAKSNYGNYGGSASPVGSPTRSPLKKNRIRFDTTATSVNDDREEDDGSVKRPRR
jgi:hypothetical protein